MMRTHKGMRSALAALAVLCLLCGGLSAQTAVGKLTGRVTDGETGEALPGANVLIVGTSFGAAANIEGNYFILNLVPGSYEIRFNFIGYQSQIIKDVRLVAGVTKELNAALKPSTLEIEEIVVVADKPFFEAKATNTVKIYDAKEIQNLPVRGVDRAISIGAGTVSAEGSGGVDGNATINVRGGRGSELVYIVDGVAQNGLLLSNNISQVSQDAVEQVSFQVGGYEAKYGQAQSGIVNITTKTGSSTYNFATDMQTSEWTDDYGYNLYNASLSGPILPQWQNQTFFVLGERGLFGDGDPKAISIDFKTTTPQFSSKRLPGNNADVVRLTGRTSHKLWGSASLRFGANINERNSRDYNTLNLHRYSKNNAHHRPRREERNQSYSGRFSLPFSAASYMNVNLGYRRLHREFGDGVFFDNVQAYGDTSQNPFLLAQAVNRNVDEVGIFWQSGRVWNQFNKLDENTLTLDADFTYQLKNHLLEAGGGISRGTLRYFNVFPLGLALRKDELSVEERFRLVQPFFYGYDVTGSRKTKKGEIDVVDGLDLSPKEPLLMNFYVQDRYELRNLVLNLGVRFDYFDTKADVLRSEDLPFAAGNPALYDRADFKQAEREFFVSPRIGFGFPVTPKTVFHAQFGRFVQLPRLVDLYTTVYSLDDIINDNNLPINTGNLKSEKTTQYEIGFRQILGDNVAALNVTAFYKNTRDLVNDATRFYQRRSGGQVLRYYGPSNTDFGTVRGLAMSFDLARRKYWSMAVNYTFALAEGTGSSVQSSTTATFRNNSGEIPKVIAPLDFDQRHTGTVNVGFNTSRDQLGLLENVSLNVLASFHSGTPYTPLQSQDLLAGTSNYGDTRGYVNSAYGPGGFLINLKLEKEFQFGNFSLRPYVWVENLLDSDNIINVYRSTGSAYTAGYLNTDEGKKIVASRPDPAAYSADYASLERDPSNFGIPRTIRLGARMNLSGIRF